MRCIVYSSKDGSVEGLYFTEDTETPAEDFIPIGTTVDHDFEVAGKFPSSFPTDYNFERQ